MKRKENLNYKFVVLLEAPKNKKTGAYIHEDELIKNIRSFGIREGIANREVVRYIFEDFFTRNPVKKDREIE